MIIDNEIIEKCPTTEHAYLLMDIAVNLNGIIQRYYWTSKFDEDVLSEIDPKIIDVYNCTVWIRGNNLEKILEEYYKRKQNFDKIGHIYTSYTEQEIKELANRFIKNL